MKYTDKSKSTVLVISMGFLLIYIFAELPLFLYLSLAVGTLGLSDSMSRRIDKLWMGFAKLLSYIVPNILLTLVFFLILYPFAMIFQLTRKDSLRLSSGYKSYWVETEETFDKKSFEKTW